MRTGLTAVLVVFVLVVGGCGGGGTKSAVKTVTKIAATTNPTGTASVTTHGRFHYPKALVDRYMQSCTNGETKKRAYCGCTLDKLSSTVSFGDFARIGFAGGKIPPRIKKLITQAAIACANKL